MTKGKHPPDRNQLKYSTGLLEKFQDVYFRKFNTHISKEKAVSELDFLATVVSLLLANKATK